MLMLSPSLLLMARQFNCCVGKKKYKNVIHNFIFIIIASGSEREGVGTGGRKHSFSRPLPSLELSRLLLHLLIMNRGYLGTQLH